MDKLTAHLIAQDENLPQALTLGIVQDGFAGNQSLVHLAQTWRQFDLNWTGTSDTGDRSDYQTLQEASNSVPLTSAERVIRITFPVNFCLINPTVKGATVYLTIGQHKMRWVNIAGTYYPVSTAQATSAGTCRINFPTRQHFECVFAIAPTISQAGYADMASVVFGYLPTADEMIPGIR